jgi:hypothetical protein
MFINHLSLLFHNFYDGLNTENGNFHKFYWALTKASITLSQPEVLSGEIQNSVKPQFWQWSIIQTGLPCFEFKNCEIIEIND